MFQPTSTIVKRPSTLVAWCWRSQLFMPVEQLEPKRPPWVKRKCRPGQVWKYATGGVACIVTVEHLDYAPQCEAILCRSLADIGSVPRHHNGIIRTTGIMERELVELIGEWVPQFVPPNTTNRPTHGQQE